MSAMGLDFSVPFSFTTFPALVFFQQIAHRSLRSLKFFFSFVQPKVPGVNQKPFDWQRKGCLTFAGSVRGHP